MTLIGLSSQYRHSQKLEQVQTKKEKNGDVIKGCIPNQEKTSSHQTTLAFYHFSMPTLFLDISIYNRKRTIIFLTLKKKEEKKEKANYWPSFIMLFLLYSSGWYSD